MTTIRVAIVSSMQTEKRTVEVPDDVEIRRLIPALVSRMGFPSLDQRGQAIEYDLKAIKGNELVDLNRQDTFATAGIVAGDLLELIPEMKAGESEFEEKTRSESPELRWREAPGEVKLNIGAPYNLLHIGISLPVLLTIDEFLDRVLNRVRAVEFVYAIFALLHSNDAETVKAFLGFLEGQTDSTAISNSQLQRFLIAANTDPLRLASVRYGSPASFDFLGIGKVLEVLKDTIKDLAWRGQHEKQMAELERRGKQTDIDKDRMEIEKTAAEIATRRLEAEKVGLEIAAQKLELLQKMTSLQLSDNDRRLVVSVLLPRMVTIANDPVTSLLIEETKT